MVKRNKITPIEIKNRTIILLLSLFGYLMLVPIKNFIAKYVPEDSKQFLIGLIGLIALLYVYDLNKKK